MLLVAIDFIINIFIYMHLQSYWECTCIVNNVIQYKKAIAKRKLIFKSYRLFIGLLNCWKNKSVCFVRQIVTNPKKQMWID